MAQIQITDLNPSDSELMDELTPEQLLAINGGGFWGDLFIAIGEFLNSL
jgi:exopolysaccharide biosynthesis predicted pyruvyltransferase EpsI